LKKLTIKKKHGTDNGYNMGNLTNRIMRSFIIVLTTLVILTAGALSQPKTGKISGTVLDKKSNAPIEGADVILYKQADSSLVKGTQTDASGAYVIADVPEGKFYLRINLVGYNFASVTNVQITAEQKEVVVNPVKLGQGETTTEEIIVEGEKSLIEFRPDKRIFNVSKDITSQGGTLIDLLRNVPSVSVDQDLKGRTGTQCLSRYRQARLNQLSLSQIPRQSLKPKVQLVYLI
jgi:hypothetical protein